MAEITPRKAQLEILKYVGGPLAIAAVPGAGKTTTLVMLATKLILEGRARPSQLLILTYTRSAAVNIRQKIRKSLAEKGIVAHGLRAQTIHGFCYDMLQRHAGRLGLQQGFQTMETGEQKKILNGALQRFLSSEENRLKFQRSWGLEEPPQGEAAIKLEEASLRAAIKALGLIKGHKLSLDVALEALEAGGLVELPEMLLAYESERLARGQLDYDDMILKVNELLANDQDLRQSLQRRFRYVFEDEAQDSTPGQQAIIDQLVEGHGNLVRVGDSNQSIYATFTLNSPESFRQFCQSNPRVTMDESSRSCEAIIGLANQLVHLPSEIHQAPLVGKRAFELNDIRPAEDGNNPPNRAKSVVWSTYASKKDQLEDVVKSVKAAWETAIGNKHLSVAVLVATNRQVDDYRSALAARGVDVAEGGSQGQGTVRVAEILSSLVRFLMLDTDDNHYREDLIEAFLTLKRQREGLFQTDLKLLELRGALLLSTKDPRCDWRRLLAPGPQEPLTRHEGLSPTEWQAWRDFLSLAGGLLAKRYLPPVDLITAVAETFFETPYELSIAQVIAMQARRLLYAHPDYRLADMGRELFSGGASSDRLFPKSLKEIEPTHNVLADDGNPKPVTILTLHSAKGLEFDCVFIPELNNARDFPWLETDPIQTSKRELLAEKTLERLGGTKSPSGEKLVQEAALAQVEERLRLLYVGITRAQQFLRLSYVRPSETHRTKYPHLVVPDHIRRLEQLSP